MRPSDNFSMKRVSFLLNSLVLLSLFTIVSCGSDNQLSGKSSSSSSNSLTGAECGCNSTYLPVCGRNSLTGTNQTYDNQCIASCFKASNIVQARCECEEDMMVCGVDGREHTECEARNFRIVIKNYGPCSR